MCHSLRRTKLPPRVIEFSPRTIVFVLSDTQNNRWSRTRICPRGSGPPTPAPSRALFCLKTIQIIEKIKFVFVLKFQYLVYFNI